MNEVLIYGIGSPIVVDIEQSLFRAKVEVVAGFQNFDGPSFLDNSNTRILRTLSENLKNIPFLVPFFSPGNRQTVAREAKQKGLTTPFTLIDPTSITPQNLILGAGVYVNAGCSVGAASEIGAFGFINRGSSIGHHFLCEPFVSIGPGVVIAGGVTIEKGAYLGAGCVVLPKVKIGKNSVVGAGAVVTKDVPSNTLVIGNPARPVKEIAGYNGIGVE